MTRSKKLLIAATLLATSYGVAAMLGRPPGYIPSRFAPSAGLPQTSTVVPVVSGEVGGPQGVGAVRLLPDVSTAAERGLDKSANSEATSVVAAEASAAAAPVMIEETPATLVAEPSMPLLRARTAPRARLKNEAPRPLRDQAADESRSLPPRAPQPIESDVEVPPVPGGAAIANTDVWPAGFSSDMPVDTPSMPEAVSKPSTAPQLSTAVSPPPWPMEESTLPRTHVVADGDTLPKLAGRYLDDPRRSQEIFALNRGVLLDPALLPIGAELTIPAFGSAADVDRVELRPMPSEMFPRAHLLRPIPVE